MVFDVPVELGLPYVPTIGSDRMDSGWKEIYDVIEEGNGVYLCMVRVDHQRAYPCRVIDSRVLIAAHSPAVSSPDLRYIDVHLHLVSRHGLGVAMRVQCPPVRLVWQLANAIPHLDAIYAGKRDLDVVLPFQIPNDSQGPSRYCVRNSSTLATVDSGIRRGWSLAIGLRRFRPSRGASPCAERAVPHRSPEGREARRRRR